MNARQKRFCDEYLVSGNATQAAIRAGYSPKTANEQGNRLLANVSVKAYIKQQLDRLHSKRTADAREIVEYLTGVMRGDCTDADGTAPAIRDRLKAAELLGKRWGIFTDKVSLDVQPVVLINDLPDEPPGGQGAAS